MKPEYISCLVESISEIFSAMLNSETTSGSMGMTTGRNSETFIGAHISFSGPADGVVMLSFPVITATNVSRALTCTEGTIPREMLEDCVVELVGILAARSTFRDLASSPVRVGGPCSEAEENGGTGSQLACAMLEIPFESNMGPFSLHIALSSVLCGDSADRCVR